MATLLTMGEHRVTRDGAWVNLWHGSKLEQTMPAHLFPKHVVDQIEVVTEMIHSQERATEALIDELELRGYEVRPVTSPDRGPDCS